MENKVSTLAFCAFRNHEFAQFFTALNNGAVAPTTAAHLRQIFGEVMAGVSTDTGDTGFRPVSLSGKRSLGSLWHSFGGTTATEAIAIVAAKRGAKIGELRKFLRAYNGERLARGQFLRKEEAERIASQVWYDEDGDSYTNGSFDEDMRLVSLFGCPAHRVGRAYFIEGNLSEGTYGTLWVKS